MKRIPQNTCIYKNIPHKEMPFSPRNKGWFHTTIKNSKPSKIKVCIIYLSFGTLDLWKFSNLTFGGYLACIILVPSVRSSYLSRRFCPEHARTVQLTDDFWHHQLAPFVGKKTVTTILLLPKQRIVWYSLTRWQPITITKRNHALLSLKDKYRP